jgi:hypothetical protein
MGGGSGGSGSGGRSGDAGQPGEVFRAASQMKDAELKAGKITINNELEKAHAAREDLRGMNRAALNRGDKAGSEKIREKLATTDNLIKSLNKREIEIRKEIRIRGI